MHRVYGGQSKCYDPGMNSWETPSFVEIDMSAEIGGYQGDYGDRPNGPDHAPEFAENSQPARNDG